MKVRWRKADGVRRVAELLGWLCCGTGSQRVLNDQKDVNKSPCFVAHTARLEDFQI